MRELPDGLQLLAVRQVGMGELESVFGEVETEFNGESLDIDFDDIVNGPMLRDSVEWRVVHVIADFLDLIFPADNFADYQPSHQRQPTLFQGNIQIASPGWILAN